MVYLQPPCCDTHTPRSYLHAHTHSINMAMRKYNASNHQLSHVSCLKRVVIISLYAHGLTLKDIRLFSRPSLLGQLHRAAILSGWKGRPRTDCTTCESGLPFQSLWIAALRSCASHEGPWQKARSRSTLYPIAKRNLNLLKVQPVVSKPI